MIRPADQLPWLLADPCFEAQLSRNSRLGEKVENGCFAQEIALLSAQRHIENRTRSRRGSYGRVLYNRHRYYDPALGRYISADPIGQWGGVNLYAYAFNSPISFGDPYGLYVWPGAAAGAATTTGAATTGGVTVGAAAFGATGVALAGALGYGIGSLIEPLAREGVEAALEWAFGDPYATGEPEASADPQTGEPCPEPQYGATPEGRPYTRHYGEETGPERNIPGSVVDHVVNSNAGVDAGDGKTVYYDAGNDLTVVTGDGGSIVSARRGKPRPGQY